MNSDGRKSFKAVQFRSSDLALSKVGAFVNTAAMSEAAKATHCHHMMPLVIAVRLTIGKGRIVAPDYRHCMAPLSFAGTSEMTDQSSDSPYSAYNTVNVFIAPCYKALHQRPAFRQPHHAPTHPSIRFFQCPSTPNDPPFLTLKPQPGGLRRPQDVTEACNDGQEGGG